MVVKKDFTQPSRREKKFTSLVNGIASAFPANGTIVIDGTSYQKPAFLSLAQSFLTPEVAAREGHITLQGLIAAKDANEEPADIFYSNTKKALIVLVGVKNPSGLSPYGITPPAKRAKATSAENVIRAAKSNETRQARDTMGSKEKSAITGNPPGSVTVTKTGKIVPNAANSKGGGGTT